MKKKSTFKKKKLKKPSLTVKWALASSFFIFVVFTIFAVLTYQTAVNLFVEKERKNAEQITDEAINRLSKANEELNLSNTYEKLTSNGSEEREQNWRTADQVEPLINVDSFFSDLGQPELSLYVYNLDEELVFKTRKKEVALSAKKTQEPAIKTIDETTGFVMIEPIQSNWTKEQIGYVQTFYELTSFYEIRNRLIRLLILIEAISLILSSVLGYFLSAYYLRPLKVLRNTMQEIQKKPQSDIYAPEINTNDELSDLADLLNNMLDRMRSYTEQQEQFVEDVSHELRTPVAVIEGHLNMLNRWGKDDPEILDESLKASVQEISRMKTLIQEMLDLSRADQVQVHYSNETSQAKEVIYQVFNNFKLVYPDFVFTLDDDLFEEKTVKIYRNHFEQILIIILDNAVKYSTDRKEINISVSSNTKELEIVIQDFGEGIPQEDLKKIFHRFYRVDKARARTKGGNGLGLSIAKKLLDSYKGKIMAQSSMGQGTIFRLTLPILKDEDK